MKTIINNKQVNLKYQPDVYSTIERARYALKNYVKPTWLVLANNEIWAVCPRDFNTLISAGCKAIK